MRISDWSSDVCSSDLMTRHYLGIDIGTYQSKGVLVAEGGGIVATAARPHRMLVPRAGWAEHRATEDWWGDFTAICREILEKSRVDPAAIRAVGCSGIGPCMLPVDRDGEPPMNKSEEHTSELQPLMRTSYAVLRLKKKNIVT